MSLYTNEGDKISMAALFALLDYDHNAQQIERGEFYGYVNYLVWGLCEIFKNLFTTTNGYYIL